MTITRALGLALAMAVAAVMALLWLSDFADIPCQDGNWSTELKTCVPDGR